MDNFKSYVETLGKFEKMHFEIKINARLEKVFQTMFDEKKYKEWTSVFNPTSHYKGSWKKGSKILFLGTDNDGNQGGMVSRIRENIPNKFVSIEHLGLIKNGKEITDGKEVKEWAGALENYTFVESGGKTIVYVAVDTNQEFKSYFMETWPNALKKLKEVCES